METQGNEDIPTMLARVWKTYKAPIILGSGSILFIVLSLTILIKSTQTSTPITFSSEHDATVAGIMRGGALVIDVAGAVRKPGVYTLAAGSRVEDAIEAAGGLSDDVDGDRLAKVVNRAAKLSDGAKLYIPKMGDRDDTSYNRIVQRDESSTSHNTQNISTVSVNAASQSELEALSGIGPATARKIIFGRPYTSLEDLVVKKVIGQAAFDKLKGQLTL